MGISWEKEKLVKPSSGVIRPESHGKTALGKTQLLGISILEEDDIVIIIMLVGGVALAR